MSVCEPAILRANPVKINLTSTILHANPVKINLPVQFYVPTQSKYIASKNTHSLAGYDALRVMGKLRKVEGVRGGCEEGEEGGREGVLCDRVPDDGMRSDGEASDRAEEDSPSAQVS